jgi:hypothetical protein
MTFGGFKIFSKKDCPEVIRTVTAFDTIYLPFPAVVNPVPDKTITQVKKKKSKTSHTAPTHKDYEPFQGHEGGEIPQDWSEWEFIHPIDTFSLSGWGWNTETINIYFDTLNTDKATVYSEIWTKGTLELFKPTVRFNNNPTVVNIHQIKRDLGIYPAATFSVSPDAPSFSLGGFFRYKYLFSGYQYNFTNQSHNVTVGGAIEF